VPQRRFPKRCSLIKKKAKIRLFDLLLACVILVALGYAAYRITVHLHYKWDWESVPQFLLRFDEESGGWVPNVLLLGLYNTIRLSLWGTFLATLIGLVMGLCRVSHNLFSRLIGRTYVELVRNVPPLVLIFIFYYFLSGQVMSFLGIDSFLSSRSQGFQDAVALFLAPPSMFSAFVSALITLGLSRWQQLRYVILPLAAQRILPPLAGQFISTIKDSAIVSVISIPELTFQGMELMSATYLIFEVWIVITALYLLLTLALSLAIGRWEIHLRRSEA